MQDKDLIRELTRALRISREAMKAARLRIFVEYKLAPEIQDLEVAIDAAELAMGQVKAENWPSPPLHAASSDNLRPPNLRD